MGELSHAPLWLMGDGGVEKWWKPPIYFSGLGSYTFNKIPLIKYEYPGQSQCSERFESRMVKIKIGGMHGRRFRSVRFDDCQAGHPVQLDSGDWLPDPAPDGRPSLVSED
jgi:hypothetical protein